MKTKVKVIFPANKPGQPSWPYVDYDVEKKRDEVLGALGRHLPEMEFSADILKNTEEAETLVAGQSKKFDGYLIYMTAMWTQIEQVFARKVRPVVISDDLYAGSGGLLSAHAVVQNEKLPAVTVASSDFRDTIEAVRLFDVMRKMRESRILVISDNDKPWGATPGIVDGVRDVFGVEVVFKTGKDLWKVYEQVPEKEAAPFRDMWINEALEVVEPDSDEILKSARLHLALKTMMKQAKADAVTVDCLGLYYSSGLAAYPCFSFFQLNNEGSTGVCEADVESTVSQLILRYLAGRPGYVSDPVIDTAANQIVYAHCVATNRVFGPDGVANPYIIRSHAEDRKGASVQSLMPLGETVTTIKTNSQAKSFAIHNGRAVANVNDEKGCRTKLAAEVDAQVLLDNYRMDIFGWHRVTCFGNHRKACLNLARLYNLKLYEEDRS